VKTVGWWGLALFLAGMATFGIVKSLDLLVKNADLGHSLASLNTRIEEMRQAIQETQLQLEESGVINEQLAGEITHLKGSLAQKEEKMAAYRRYAVLLKKRMRDTEEMNTALSEDSRQYRELLTRVRLENQELRRKMSSVKELKAAIRELKHPSLRKPKPERRRTPARRRERTQPPLPDPETVMGNEGFLVRDGMSTFYDKVDIRVRPALEAVTPS
jgi:septal ring factor EnvC (AmiA/AmiB activator)